MLSIFGRLGNATWFRRGSRARSWFCQGVLVLGVLLVANWLSENVIENLRSANMASGFDFLNSRAGFGISQSLIDYGEESSYGRALWVGFLNTLLVSLICILASTIVGFVVGIGRLSSNWLVRAFSLSYVEVFRNIPPLLVVFFWYFGVLSVLPLPRDSISLGPFGFLNNRGVFLTEPIWNGSGSYTLAGVAVGLICSGLLFRWARVRQERTGQEFPKFWGAMVLVCLSISLGFALDGFPLSFVSPVLGAFNLRGGIQILPELLSLCLSLSLYTAAFIAEIVRGGIEGVGSGQIEAAQSLGLRSSRVLRFVIVPQALRSIIPLLTSQYLNVAKNSSLAIAVGYPDLVSVGGTILNQTGRVIEIVSIWMLAYLFLSLSASLFMNWFNNRMKLVGS